MHRTLLPWRTVVCHLFLAASCVLTTAKVGRAQEGAAGPSPEAAAKIAELLAKNSDEAGDKKEFPKFADVTKGAEVMDGLFKLYKKEQHLYAAIKPNQFGEMFLGPMVLARGLAMSGTPLNFGDEWVLTFKRVGDEVQLIRKNIYYEAEQGTPLAKAVEQNYTDSILMSLPIRTINEGTQEVLIDLADIYLTNFAQLPFGETSRRRTTWHKVKAYAKNIELQVEATFEPPGMFGGMGPGIAGDGVVDSRGITVVIHYSLMKRPEPGYKPRYADYRVGHFINATKDFSSDDPQSQFRRRVNRWRLEKSDPKAKLSPPKKQIVWWVENTVPHEYRPYVESGILEWNKAFERIGFRNAIGVRWQNSGDEFDAEDTNYCTFRWITTPNTYAMSGLRADPITGEMIDGDVIFDASWVRAWKDEYALLTGQPVARDSQGAPIEFLARGEIISPIMAARYGYGLPVPAPKTRQRLTDAQSGLPGTHVNLVPDHSGPLHALMHQRISGNGHAFCQCALAKRQEYGLAAMVLAIRGEEAAKDGDGGEKKKLELPAEFIGNAIKEVVMHEVGHSLGLRHNFKASSIRSLDEINDPAVTSTKGMAGSVMDYNPVNIARKGAKQGEYTMTSIGPYDYWAIEYAYRPLEANEEDELRKIAARSPEPDLVFATDEDMYLSNDPLVNTYDLGNDPLAYAKDRLALSQELLTDLSDKIVADGESWARLRQGFMVLISQFGNSAYLSSSYIAGQHVSRDAKGGANARDPITPVDGDKQREALKFLCDNILSDAAFRFPPSLLRKMGTETWYHHLSNSFGQQPGINLLEYVSGIQSIPLSICLSADVLNRLQAQQLMVDDPRKALAMEEVFRAFTDSVFSEFKDEKLVTISTIRRNLQRDYGNRLSRMVIGERRSALSDMYPYALFSGGASVPADARNLARLHLKEIQQKLEAKLTAASGLDEGSKAHLEQMKDQIAKVFAAELEAGSP
jgi:Met-zincin/Domain of unknown function (DUF5117)